MDIIGLNETHCQDGDNILNLEGYTLYQFNRKLKKKRSKKSGGLAVLIRNEIKQGVEVIKQYHDYYVWLKLDRNMFSCEKSIYICLVYQPPVSSVYNDANSDTSLISLIESDLVNLVNDDYVLVMGDLNGRTGVEYDFINDDNTIPTQDDVDMYRSDANIGRRVSQDMNKNARGDEIIELCTNHKLRILNGRLIGDSQGLFTCHQSKGSSTVDYMIANEELFHRFKYFHVHTFDGTLSDHCLISSLLKLDVV